MIATRIGPDMRMAVVGAPSYFKRFPPPKSPSDLVKHRCINLRLPTHGGMLQWHFKKGRRELNVKVEGHLIFNNLPPIIQATLDGFGLAYTVVDAVQTHVERGRLVSVLDEWCPVVQGYHLYYPSRRYNSPAFGLLLDALRRPQAARDA